MLVQEKHHIQGGASSVSFQLIINWNDQHPFLIICLSYLQEIEFYLNSLDDPYFCCG